MIDTRLDPVRRTGHLVLVPNRSLSWRAAKGVVLGVCVVALVIGGAFAAMGMWPVLPFAGLEAAALAVAMHATALRQSRRQVIILDAAEVRLETGRRGPEHSTTLPRAWARLEVRPGAASGHPERLFLCFRDRTVELAQFLTGEERQEFVDLWGRELRERVTRQTRQDSIGKM